jgi:hypothetical protein
MVEPAEVGYRGGDVFYRCRCCRLNERDIVAETDGIFFDCSIECFVNLSNLLHVLARACGRVW